MDEQFDEKTMPNEFLCPIFQQIMKDPVLTIDGFSFERRAIQEWFNKGKVTNPVTNKPLASTTLVQNRALRHVIQHHNTRLREIERQAQLNAQKLTKQHNLRIATMYPQLINQLGTIDLDKFTIFSNQASNLRNILKNTKQRFGDLKRCCDKNPNNCKECKNLLEVLKLFKHFMDKDVQQTLSLQPLIPAKQIIPQIIYYLIINTQVIKAIDFRRLKKEQLKKRQLKGIMLSMLSMQQILSKIRKQAKIPEKDFIRLWITDQATQKLYDHIVQQVQTITGSYLCKVKRVGKKVQNLKQKINKLGLNFPNYVIIEHGPGQEYVFRDQQAKCDYCYRVKKIQANCQCKKVFYCSKECHTKDKPYHQNVCKLNQNAGSKNKIN